MTDIFDRASELEELQREHAIARQRSRKTTPCEAEHEYCADCAEEIEPGRRAAVPGCTRCIGCQRKAEQRHKALHG